MSSAEARSHGPGAVWEPGTPTVRRLRMLADAEGQIALGTITLAALEKRIAEADADSACRVLVLSGTPGCFCRGMDLAAIAAGTDAAGLDAALSSYASVLLALRNCRKLVIALVDGDVMGGGIGLAAAADVVVATERSLFGLPEVLLGLLPAMVLPILLERMTPHRARRFTLMGTSIGATQAQNWGLVDTLVTDATGLEGALRTEVRQALRAHPDAIATCKHLINDLHQRPLREAVALGRTVTAGRLAMDDVQAGIAAFVEGDLPPWFAK